MQYYYKQVEGMPVIIDLETIIDGTSSWILLLSQLLGDSKINFSGGVIIQPLPQKTIEETHALIEKYKQRLKKYASKLHWI